MNVFMGSSKNSANLAKPFGHIYIQYKCAKSFNYLDIEFLGILSLVRLKKQEG